MPAIVWIVVGLALGVVLGAVLGYNRRKQAAEAQNWQRRRRRPPVWSMRLSTAQPKTQGSGQLEAKDEAFRMKAEVDELKAEADRE